MSQGEPATILALDVGSVRIGVARASIIARLPEPLGVVNNDEAVGRRINEICREHNAQKLIIGLPRNLSGQETAQTEMVRQFVDKLADQVSLPVVFQDEAATSVKAEAELAARGRPFDKGEVDALAATYILEDYLSAEFGGHAKL